jgi:hypothetical protein
VVGDRNSGKLGHPAFQGRDYREQREITTALPKARAQPKAQRAKQEISREDCEFPTLCSERKTQRRALRKEWATLDFVRGREKPGKAGPPVEASVCAVRDEADNRSSTAAGKISHPPKNGRLGRLSDGPVSASQS